MKPMLIVETRDPVELRDTEWMADLAVAHRRNGNSTRVLLAENGTFAARTGASAANVQALTKAGVEVFADRFAMAERGIRERDLAPGVKPAEIELVLAHMETGGSVMWR